MKIPPTLNLYWNEDYPCLVSYLSTSMIFLKTFMQDVQIKFWTMLKTNRKQIYAHTKWHLGSDWILSLKVFSLSMLIDSTHTEQVQVVFIQALYVNGGILKTETLEG